MISGVTKDEEVKREMFLCTTAVFLYPVENRFPTLPNNGTWAYIYLSKPPSYSHYLIVAPTLPHLEPHTR